MKYILQFVFLMACMGFDVKAAALQPFQLDEISVFVRARNAALKENPDLAEGFSFTWNNDTQQVTYGDAAHPVIRQLEEAQYELATHIYTRIYENLRTTFIEDHARTTRSRPYWQIASGVGYLGGVLALRYTKLIGTLPFVDEHDLASPKDLVKVSLVGTAALHCAKKFKEAVTDKFLTPAVFSLSTVRLEEEVRLLSVITAVRTLEQGEEIPVDREMRIVHNVIDCMRAATARRLFLQHVAAAVVDRPRAILRHLRGFQPLQAPADMHVEEKGSNYVSQLLKLHSNLPSYNLFYRGNYDLIAPEFDAIFA